MNELPRHPSAWLENLKIGMEETETVPLFGYHVPFDFNAWSEKIKTLLNLPTFQLSLHRVEEVGVEKHLEGLGIDPFKLSLSLSPLTEVFYFLMGKEDAGAISQATLTIKSESKGFSSPVFIEGFYRYLILRILNALTLAPKESKPWADLSLKMNPQTPMPEERAFCIDLAIQLPNQKILGRLLLPLSFQKAFQTYFSTHLTAIPLENAKGISLSLSPSIGHTTLPLEEWNTAQVGDCLLLDHSSYDINQRKGTAILKLGELALFRIRFKEHSLKIVDYAFYYEEYMNENSPPSEESEGEDPITNTPESGKMEMETLIQTKNVPLMFSVEVGKIKMDLAKLLELQPGNTLELPLHPEEGVHLILNGKTVATGELVKMGEQVGFKILRMG